MIEAQGLTRAFGERTVVRDVSFRVEPGQVCVLLGPNGAGKTTTIRMLLGLIRPTAGAAVVAGFPLPGSPKQAAELRAKAGLLTETPGFYDRLSAVENLTLFGRLYHLEEASLAKRIREYLVRFALWDRQDEPIATFSKGMKQRLAIVRAVFHDPDVIFFDEPTSGLDPQSARDVRHLILSLKRAGRTIIVCTHNLAEAAELADVVGVIQERLLAFGRPDTLGRSGREPRYRVVVSGSASEAARQASTVPGVRAAETSSTDLELAVAEPAEGVPAVVRALVQGGIGVREVRPLEASLEDIYLDAIGRAR